MEKKDSLIILNHLGVGDIINLISMAKHFLEKYKKVDLLCLKKVYKNIHCFFPKNINFLIVKNRNYVGIRKWIDQKFKNSDKIYLGYFKNRKRKTNTFIDLPFIFYDEANINRNLFWNNKILINNTACDIYERIKEYNIIFIHNLTGCNMKFNYLSILEKLNIEIDKYLLINPNKNLYEKTNKKYLIANTFINLPISNYTKIIENAEYNILVDSSFFCMALQLNIKTDNNYFISRCFDYESYLWKEENGFNENSGKKIFKKIDIKLQSV